MMTKRASFALVLLFAAAATTLAEEQYRIATTHSFKRPFIVGQCFFIIFYF